MALIDPFSFTPTGPLDRLLAYFYCTWMRAQYTEHEPSLAVIYDLMGATVETFPEQQTPLALVPRVDVATTSAGAVVLIRGTTTPEQLQHQIFGASLVPFGTGSISSFLGYVNVFIWDKIKNSVPANWVAAGHSMGGAVAGIISRNGAQKIITAGAPKEGNGTYANSRPSPLRLSLTNQNDPVPLLPPRQGDALDFLDVPFPTFVIVGYRHWGIRWHLFWDGSTLRPPNTPGDGEASAYLIEAIGTGEWVLNHYATEYARRLRIGIPVEFPSEFSDVDYPGLKELDDVNLALHQADAVLGIEVNPLSLWAVDAVPTSPPGQQGAGVPNYRCGD